MEGHHLIPIVLLTQCLVAQASNPGVVSEQVTTFVQVIIQKEFEGKIPARNPDNLFMTKALKRKVHEEPLALVFFPDADPLHVVQSYKILSPVTSSKGVYSVAVEFAQLARTEGEGQYGANPRKLIRDVQQIKLVYQVKVQGGRCFLVEPPSPCLSKSALIAIYENLASHNKTIKVFQTDLEFLRTL